MQSYTLTNLVLHWNMDQKTEIRSYIKCRIRLNIDSKQIFKELCGIYGPQTISMRTVFRWVEAFKTGKFSVEDDTRPGRPKTSVTKAKCARELLKSYKGCNSRVISNLLTGDETCVHMFEPQRRADYNKQWKRKDKKTPMYCQENHKFEKDVVRNFL